MTASARSRQPAAGARGRPWPEALPGLVRHVARTTGWGTLLTGCLTATAMLWAFRYAASTSHGSVDESTVRFTVLPAVAALAFVPRTAFRPVIDATPVPAWVTSAGQVLLAAPVLALTCWLQFLLIGADLPPHIPAPPAAGQPLIAQLTGWCAVTVAVAACTDRSRYADLGGAVAAPASLALIAVATYGPGTRHLLAAPPAGTGTATAAWYAVTGVALVVTCAALRDRWHRYLRGRR